MGYLRVRDRRTGHEYTIREAQFNDDAHRRLDKDPLGHDGLPRPPKYRVPLGKPPSPSVRRRRAAPDPVTPDPDAVGGPETDDGQPAESEEENH